MTTSQQPYRVPNEEGPQGLNGEGGGRVREREGRRGNGEVEGQEGNERKLSWGGKRGAGGGGKKKREGLSDCNT
jgi:hypothetical protein